MIRLSRTVASSRSLVLYEDSEDPALLYFMPTSAELCRSGDGGVRFEQRMLRSGGSTGTGVSRYRWSVRSVVPAAELRELAEQMTEGRKHPVQLKAVPRLPTVGATILTDGARDLLLCRAEPRAVGFGTVTMGLIARDSAEPALAERFMGSSGLEVSLEYRVTGAATPFRGSMEANFGAIRHHLLTTFPEKAFVSWSQVAGEIDALLSSGMIRLRVESGTVDSSASVSAVSRQVVNRLMFLQRFPPRALPYPAMYGARFRIKERGEFDRWETIDLTEFDLETRALPVSLHIRSVPKGAFHGLDGAYQELTQELAFDLARDGLPVGDIPL